MKNITLWVRRYVTVYGIIMLCTFFMCLLFNPASELPVVSYFGKILVFSLLALVSLAVYYSREELTQRAWWVRTVLHAAVLEAVLLPLAHVWGFWHGGSDVVFYAAFILLAKVLWHLVDYGIDAKTAEQINERIRECRLEQRKQLDENR